MIRKSNGVFDPLSKSRKLFFYVGVTALFFSTASAYGQTAILDNIAQSYKTAATGWTGTLLGFANRLFALLAIIEFTWSCAVWALDKNEYQSFVSAVVKKFMWIGAFYMILLNGQTWIPAIIDSFTNAGIAASGSGGLSPSEVFTTGLDNAAVMLEGIKNMSLWDDMGAIIIAGLSGIAIVIAFAIIAGQLLVALVESYIAISAGLIFLGFGGSRWTTDFVQKYIGYAMATGVKLFMLFLIVGIGNAQAQSWKAMLLTIGTPGTATFNIILTVLGGSILLAYLAMQIPAQAAAMLAGSPSLTAGAAAQSAGLMAAGVVGAGAAGAAATIGGAKSTGGLAKAVGAAWGEAGAQGHSGIGRAVATLGNMGTAAASDTGNRIEQAVAPTKGGRMADISTGRAGEIAAANTPAPGAGGGLSVPPPSTPSGGSSQPPAPGAGAAASGPTPAPSPAGSGQAAAPMSGASPATAGGAGGPSAMPQASTTAKTAQSSSGAVPVGSGQAAAPVGGAASAAPGGAGGQAGPQPSASATTAAQGPSGGAASPLEPIAGMPSPAGVVEQAQGPQAPGFEDRFRDLSQVRPPQIPNDGAPSASVSIRFDSPQD